MWKKSSTYCSLIISWQRDSWIIVNFWIVYISYLLKYSIALQTSDTVITAAQKHIAHQNSLSDKSSKVCKKYEEHHPYVVMFLYFHQDRPQQFHQVFYSRSYLNDFDTDVASSLKGKVLCVFIWFSSATSIATEISKYWFSECFTTVRLWSEHTQGFNCKQHPIQLQILSNSFILSIYLPKNYWPYGWDMKCKHTVAFNSVTC